MSVIEFNGEAIDIGAAEPPPPLFRVIARGALSLIGDDKEIRPCEHPRFILDDGMLTVTCGECKQRVEPYAALRTYATWWIALERKRADAEHAEWSRLVQAIREMAKRRMFSDAERETIRRNSWAYGKGSLQEMRELHAELTKRIHRAKQARRAAARSV